MYFLVDSDKNVHQKIELNFLDLPCDGAYRAIKEADMFVYTDTENPFIGYIVSDEDGNITYFDMDGNIVQGISYGGKM